MSSSLCNACEVSLFRANGSSYLFGRTLGDLYWGDCEERENIGIDRNMVTTLVEDRFYPKNRADQRHRLYGNVEVCVAILDVHSVFALLRQRLLTEGRDSIEVARQGTLDFLAAVKEFYAAVPRSDSDDQCISEDDRSSSEDANREVFLEMYLSVNLIMSLGAKVCSSAISSGYGEPDLGQRALKEKVHAKRELYYSALQDAIRRMV